MKKKLFIFIATFFLFGLFIFQLKPTKAYAQFCGTDSDCAQDQYCFLFTCQSLNGCGGVAYCPYQPGPYCTLIPFNHTCSTSGGAYYNCVCSFSSFGTGICGANCDFGQHGCGGTQSCDSGTCQCYNDCNKLANSFCGFGARGCGANYYINGNYSCGSNSPYDICCTLKPTCNTGVSCTGWSACGGYPQNTCYAGNGSQSQTCNFTTYNNGSTPCKQPAPWTNTQSCTVNDCYGGYACSGGNCVTHIYANVYTDYNHDGAKNGNDAGKAGVPVSDGFNTFNTDAAGNVTFSGLTTGGYTIRDTVPANFIAINGTTRGVTLTNTTPNQTVNFYVTPIYSISGRAFNDLNKDQKYNGSDTGVAGVTIHIAGGPTAVADMTTAADGTWATPTNLESGTYTVTYSSALPAGYQFTTASSFSVTVGNPAGAPACNTGGSLDATCGGTNNGSIANLNFGRTNETVWHQSVCFDVRSDGSIYNNPIPAAPACGGVSGAYDTIANADCTTGAGILFTCNNTPTLGLGTANANAWQAGGPAADQQECFVGAGLNVIRTSYNYLLTTARESNITPIDMTTVCGAGGLANCTLPATLPRGVYQANGPVNLNAFTFPVDPTTPQGFIFLINGDLHLLGNIIVPAGSVAAFSSSGSIYVDPSVGNTITNASDVANNNPNLEGLYSADANFIVQSNGSGTNVCNLDGTPLDKKLNIVGSVITNAAQGGGSFQDNRDLCIYDTSCPVASVGDGEVGGAGGDTGLGLSYWLSLYADGKFLNHKLYNWQELRP